RSRAPPKPPRFPYTTLFRSVDAAGSIMTIMGYVQAPEITIKGDSQPDTILIDMSDPQSALLGHAVVLGGGANDAITVTNLNTRTDRKSTRLNSSHRTISYAV